MEYSLDTVHLLAADVVGEESKEELSEEGTDRVSNLDTKVLVGSVGSTLVVDVADHGGSDGNGENVVSISEEAHAYGSEAKMWRLTSNDTCLGMEPGKVCLVNLSQSGTATLLSCHCALLVQLVGGLWLNVGHSGRWSVPGQ